MAEVLKHESVEEVTLVENGIFVNRGGVPFMQEGEFVRTRNNLVQHFVVLTNIGRFMPIGYGTDCADYRSIFVEVPAKRMSEVQDGFEYYNCTSAVHV